MFPYRDEQYTYEEALDLKHPAPEPIAQKHHAKQTEINMTFETVEDVAGFTSTVFSSSKEKVYVVEPTFINPRKTDELFHDYSTNCTIM